MAHYAKVESGVVTEVIVAEQEHIDTLSGTWVQTSYNTVGNVHALGGTPFRKNYAATGMTYDSSKNAFLNSQPFASWALNETTCLWESPIDYPSDNKIYRWDEDTHQADNSTGWVELD